MKCFYFYDCPRTGGTSIKHWFKKQQLIRRIYYGDKKGWHHVPFKPREEVSQLAPSGLRDKVFTFTILRDPIEHTASLYAKIRNHKHGYKPRLTDVTFTEWIEELFEGDRKTSPDPWGFSFVRFYDPKTHKLEQAIKNIESMNFVGFTERLNLDMELMLKLANAKEKFDNRRANNARRDFKISSVDRMHIKRIRFDDYQLVNYFRKKKELPIYG